MFAYLKLGALAAAVIGVGLLYFQMRAAKADLADAQTALTQAQGFIVKHRAREAELIATIQDRDKRAAEDRAIIDAGDKVAGDLRAEVDDLRRRVGDVREGVRHASTDSDVLRLVAGGLCGSAERLAALRAGDDHQDGAGTDQDSAGTDRSCDPGTLTAPTLRAVGDLALRFAATVEVAAGRVRGVARWQDEYNAVVTTTGQ